MGCLSPWVNWPVRKTVHKPLCNAEVKNEQTNIFTASYEFLTCTETTLLLPVPIIKRFEIRGSRVRDIKLKSIIFLENKKFHGFCLSPNIRMMPSRCVTWVGNAAWLGENIIAYKILVGERVGYTGVGKLDSEGKVILKWNIVETVWKVWTGAFAGE
jgi:hypothetical protein